MGTPFTVTSADGTAVQGWRNDATGPAVVISNGLGTPPQAWPELVDPGCGLRVVTWYHRGTHGSPRPADPRAIRVEDHAADLLALMDHEGMERAVLACWSIGVNVGFEVARTHPERVAGILAVAGVPGGTFHTMGGPWRVPRAWRHRLAAGASHALRTTGPVLTTLAGALPLTRATAWGLGRLAAPGAQPEVLLPALEEFRRHDFWWYFTLALAAADHPAMDLAFLQVPVTFLAGRRDVLTSDQDVARAAAAVPQAELHLLSGSHFLPLEFPAETTALLRALVARSTMAAGSGEPDLTPGRTT